MDNRPIVILGSARPDSDTRKLVEVLFPENTLNVLNLLDYKVNPYSYSGHYPAGDQFLKVIETILLHQQIIFATPVYWYAMSGIMKTFFDRLTDIVTFQKSIGRKLAGKETFLLAVGAEESLPPGFEVPFKLTSDYLGMKYTGSYYCPKADLHTSTEGRSTFVKSFKDNSVNSTT